MTHDKGELVIIAATILVVLAVFLWIAVVKIEGVVPGGSAAASPARPPAGIEREAPAGSVALDSVSNLGLGESPSTAPADGPGGLRFENRTGRAAEREVPSAASARRLPRGADAKLAQARLVCFRVTAYCPCEKCCGKWADGVTASSTRADHPLVAAPPEFPFGTVMTIPGYGRVRVEDRGGAIKGDRLDVFFATHQEALNWGVRWLDVEIVGQRRPEENEHGSRNHL